MEAAKRQSAFDFGVEEIRAHNLRRIGESETLFVDPGSGARTMLHELEGEVDVVRHAFPSVAMSAKLGFHRNIHSRRIYGVSEHWSEQDNAVYLTGVKGSRRSLERHELEAKYEEVQMIEARESWDAEYERTPATEPQRFYILSGAIFPIYDKIMGSSGIRNVKIARAILADGQALVGLNLSPADVPNVKQRLGIGTPLAEATPRRDYGIGRWRFVDRAQQRLAVDYRQNHRRQRVGTCPQRCRCQPRRTSRLWLLGRDCLPQEAMVRTSRGCRIRLDWPIGTTEACQRPDQLRRSGLTPFAHRQPTGASCRKAPAFRVTVSEGGEQCTR